MKKVFLIHGWDGNPQNHWFPWLSLELKACGWEVNAPQMPNAAEPKVKEWLEFLKDYIGKPDAETYFVGHSLGCIAIARYLAELSSGSPFPKGRGPLVGRDVTTPVPHFSEKVGGTPFSKGDTSSASEALGTSFSKGGIKGRIKVGGCVFVAGFSGRINIPEIREFYELPFDAEAAKKHCGKFVMIFSDNDSYVPMEKSLDMARQLGAKTILERGKGHFCASDGVTALPSALSALLRMSDSSCNNF